MDNRDSKTGTSYAYPTFAGKATRQGVRRSSTVAVITAYLHCTLRNIHTLSSPRFTNEEFHGDSN